MADAFIKLGDLLHKNINQSIGTITVKSNGM